MLRNEFDRSLSLAELGKAYIDRLAELSGETAIEFMPAAPDLIWDPVIEQLFSAADRSLTHISDDTDSEWRAKYIGYTLSMLVNALDPKRRKDFEVQWSGNRQVVGIIGKDALSHPTVKDPVTGEVVSSQQIIDETLRVLSLSERTFPIVLFLSRTDDQKIPYYSSKFEPLSMLMGGRGPRLSDNVEAGIAAIFTDNFYPTFGISGIEEIIGEEIHPWHYGKPFSLWKEGITWALLKNVSTAKGCSHKRFGEAVERTGSIIYWPFRDLAYSWEECVDSKEARHDPIYAYFSGEIGFLALSARNSGDEQFDPNNYGRYSEELEKFCEIVSAAHIPDKDTYKPEIMLPLALKWAGFESEEEFFDYVDKHIEDFAQRFLETM